MSTSVINESKWSGKGAIPAVGAPVYVRMNGLGFGTVLEHRTVEGYLGLIVKFDNPPEYYVRQKGKDTPGLVFGAEIAPRLPTTRADFKPVYTRWRHGGWYVNNVRLPSGAIGCVSNNYPDRKWRIACDKRPFESQPTFETRGDAAYAEYLTTV